MRWLVFYHIAWSSSLVLYIMISVPAMDSSSVSPALLYVNLRVAYGGLRQKRYLQGNKLKYQG
jgi:hypothetical protein